MDLTLRKLTENDEAAFFTALAEWDEKDRAWFTFDWKPGVSYEEMLAKLENNSAGAGLPAGWVPSTMLYGFVGNKIVGRLHIRHSLNENLRIRGGHIGYAVAEKYRGRGIATAMLEQALPVCKAIGIDDILITCSDTNIASWKTIERVGGKLEDKIFDEEKRETLRRYIIRL